MVLRPARPATEEVAARHVSGQWGRTWALALVLFVLLLGSYEGFWRARGFHPTRVSDEQLWVLAREQLAAQPGGIAIIGASRFQVALDLDLFAAQTGETPVQLGICYSSPVPVLEHLAADSAFHGLVLCDVTPLLFFQTGGEIVGRSEQYLAYAAEYHSPAARAEWQLHWWIEDRLICRLDELSPAKLADAAVAGNWPGANQSWLRADRMLILRFPAGYGEGQPAQTTFKRSPNLADAAARDGLIDRVAAAVQRIRARGGDVVFIELPSSGHYRAKQEQFTPRADYWDVLCARTGVLALNYLDVPGMSGYDCPDGSHLDSRDTPAVTQAVLAALEPHLRGTPWEFPH
jgi:hypothetical protein